MGRSSRTLRDIEKELQKEVADSLAEVDERMSESRDTEEKVGKFYSIKEVANLLGLHYDTITRWVRRGTLKSSQPSGRKGNHLIPESELKRLQKGSPT